VGGLDYERMAKDVPLELAKKRALKGVTHQILPELLQQYIARLEDSIYRTIYKELKRLGHLWQFQQAMQDAPQQGAAWVKKAIPMAFPRSTPTLSFSST
jgi:hypothetical protein